MTPGARLAAVLEILEQIEATPRPADAIVSGYFRARRYIGSKDRAAIAATSYDVLRHHARLTWWLARIGATPSLTSEHGNKTNKQLKESLKPPSPWEGDGGGVCTEESDDEKKSPPFSYTPPTQPPPKGGGASLLDGKQPSLPPSLPRLRLLAHQRLVEKRTAAELDGLFDGRRFSPAALTGSERAFLEKLKGHTIAHPDMPEAVACECPAWSATGLLARFGKRFPAEMQALLGQAPLDLRINPLKITREAALESLQKIGLKVELSPYSPLGLRVRERPSLSAISLLKEGAIEIQDEGSQLVALLVDPQPGERVVDFCAGAGGKTLALSAQMKNKGRIVACDVLENRLKRSGERFRRAGLHNIEIKPLASERDPWVKRHKGTFDRVLVDAPCSGTGTWRRNPDSRWRSLGPGLEALLPLQASILESASRLVRPGGRLVYATCSLLPEENEKQIERFLDNHPAFEAVPVQTCGAALPNLPQTGDCLSLSPAAHDTDGFFAAVMKRKDEPA